MLDFCLSEIDVGAVNFSHNGSSRKRLWIGEDLASQESSGNTGTATF